MDPIERTTDLGTTLDLPSPLKKLAYWPLLRICVITGIGILLFRAIDGSSASHLQSLTVGFTAGWAVAMVLQFGWIGLLTGLLTFAFQMPDTATFIRFFAVYPIAYGVPLALLRKWSRLDAGELPESLFLSLRPTLRFLVFSFIPSGLGIIFTFLSISRDPAQLLSSWLREISGIVAIAPFAATYLASPIYRFARIPAAPSQRPPLSYAELRSLVLAIAISALAFPASMTLLTTLHLDFSWLVFLPLLFATTSYGISVAAPGIAATVLTVTSLWRFFGWQSIYDVSELRLLTFTSGVSILIVAALVEERKRAHARIEQSLKERLELERELQHAQRMETMGRLAAGVAHDFGNFLTAINGYTSLALIHLSNQIEVRSHLEQVQKTGDTAVELVKQLLMFSRKETAEAEIIDINATLASSRRMLVSLLGGGITFDMELGPDVRPIIANRVGLQQILLNLTANARDAMPNGGRFSIRTVSADDAVRIELADTGTGIPSDKIHQIFEPFFTTKEPGKGTGMGLAIVQAQLHQMGGSIAVASNPNEGTTFTILIPVAKTVPAEVASP